VGGFGSGRYLRHGSRSKHLLADQEVLRLDIREIYKDGLLDGDARATITWFRHGRSVASIGTYSNPCDFALRLDYDYGSPPMPVRERVGLTFTPCHYGGDRPWFLCPACGRRCAVLWGRGRFLCRRCQRVAYASQNESASSRAIRRVHEIRAKLKTEGCVPIWRIRRPRYMRYERYLALLLELVRHEGVWSGHILGLEASLDLRTINRTIAPPSVPSQPRGRP
jgi:hypothetical protein